MRRQISCVILFLLAATCFRVATGKEFLTDEEITKIQDAQEIDQRVKIYLEAAALRLKTAADRFAGKDSVPGDPLEFFSLEDMLDGYYRILHAVMMNLEDAASNPGTDPDKMKSAMKRLKSTTENSAGQLEALKKIAEDQRKEEPWNLIGKAIEINNGALEGAKAFLEKKRP